MYTQSENDRLMLKKQTERQTVGQLQVENKLLKQENRKYKSGGQRNFDGVKVRNYAIKEDDQAETQAKLPMEYEAKDEDE